MDINKEIALAEANQMLEPVVIAPEDLLIAEAYLLSGNISDVCSSLDITQDVVVRTIQRREVQKFLDTVYMDVGYRNKRTLGSALDKIIETKLEELEESEMSSSKDIIDIMEFAHKMRMDELKMQLKMIELEDKRAQAVKPTSATTFNTQINDAGGNYADLMNKLLKG